MSDVCESCGSENKNHFHWEGCNAKRPEKVYSHYPTLAPDYCDKCNTRHTSATCPPAAAREGDGPYRVEEYNGKWYILDGEGDEVASGLDKINALGFCANFNAAFHAGAKEQREKDAEIARTLLDPKCCDPECHEDIRRLTRTGEGEKEPPQGDGKGAGENG